MFNVENKENDVKSQEERASKLLEEPAQQKVRRSVLREFDPFAPDSPLPPKIRHPPVEEDEVFEDAETSLSSYFPMNKTTVEVTPSRGSYGTRESLLIPELKDHRPRQLVNLNDTFELSYSECVENLSQLSSNQANITSSDDFEFNYSSKTRATIAINDHGSADQNISLMDITMDANIENDSKVACQHGGEKCTELNVGTPGNSDEQTISKLEQPKENSIMGVEHEETLFEQLETGTEEKVDRRLLQVTEGVIEVPLRTNRTFEQPTDCIDVNELIFVDTQLDRTCEVTFNANDPMNGLDPLNVENCDDIDNPLELEDNVNENIAAVPHVTIIPCEEAQIDINVSASQNKTIESRLSTNQSAIESNTFNASKDGQMKKTSEDHAADILQTDDEKETGDNARLGNEEATDVSVVKLSPKTYTNGNSTDSEYTGQSLVEPVADSQITSQSLSKSDLTCDKSDANEVKPSKAEDITLKMPKNLALEPESDEPQVNIETSTEVVETHEENHQSSSRQLFDVSHTPTAISVENIDSKVLSSEPMKLEDETIEADAVENINPEILPMKEAVNDPSTQNNDNNKLLVEKDDLKHGPNEKVHSYALEESSEKALKEDNVAEITNAIAGDNSDPEQNLPECAEAGESSVEFNKTLAGDLPASETSCKSPFSPVEATVRNSFQFKLEGVENHEQEKYQNDEVKPDVVNIVQQKLPDEEALSLAQLNEAEDVESLPKDHPGTSRPLCEPKSGDQSSLVVETEHSVGAPEKLVETSNAINKTFETLDDEISQQVTGSNVLEPSGKTLDSSNELNKTLETSIVTNISTENGENETDNHQSDETNSDVVNTFKEESPEKVGDPESHSVGHRIVENVQENHQNTSQPPCEVKNSDQIVSNNAEFAKMEDATVDQPLNASYVATNHTDVKPNLPGRIEAGSPEKLVETSDAINKTFDTLDEASQQVTESNVLEPSSRKTLDFSNELNKTLETPVPTNISTSHHIKTEIDEKETNNHQSDETTSGVVSTFKEESPGNTYSASTQLNETFDSNVQEKDSESHPIGHQIVENLQDIHSNTSQSRIVAIEAEFVKIEDATVDQPLNAYYVATDHTEVKPNLPGRVESGSPEKLVQSSDAINTTFETIDDEANQPVTESNALESSGKTLESSNELNKTLETPILTNISNSHRIEHRSEVTNTDVNTFEEESLEKRDPATTQLNATFDSNVQERDQESHPFGRQIVETLQDNHKNTSQSPCEIKNSDQIVSNNAEFDDATVNQPVNASIVLASDDDSKPKTDKVNETFEANKKEVAQKYDAVRSLNQPLPVKTIEESTESAAQLNSTFEAAATTEIVLKSNHESENGRQSNSVELSTDSNLTEAVESTGVTTTPQSIPDESESERAAEALARSLNQTIDVEEPAIVEDINSSSSSDNVNVTIENVINNRGDSCDKPEETNQKTENECDPVPAVPNQSPKVGCVEQKSHDEHDSNGTEEKITKDMMKTENAAKNLAETESTDQKSAEETMKPPNRRIECRPNIRSLRNKTQVITSPLLLNSEQTKSVTPPVQASDENERLLSDYKKRKDQLLNDLEKLQEVAAQKDQCILSYTLSRQTDRDNLKKYREVRNACEAYLIRQKEELALQKAENEKLARQFTSTEMAFSQLFEKYEKAKNVVEAYRKNESILIENITLAENQLTQLDVKCKAMQDKCDKDRERARKQIDQEKETYKQNIAKLSAMVKRLEIKASSLEISLKQKTEECQALAALCDDITGKQPS